MFFEKQPWPFKTNLQEVRGGLGLFSNGPKIEITKLPKGNFSDQLDLASMAGW